MHLTRGTIVAVARRQDYIVLAADQMSYRLTGDPVNPRHREYGCKIVRHATLPLAVATAGLKDLPEWNQGEQPFRAPLTRDLVREMFEAIRSPSDVSARLVESFAQSKILPVVKAIRERYREQTQTSSIRVDLFVAAYIEGVALSFMTRIEEGIETTNGADLIGKPGSLDVFFRYVFDFGEIRPEKRPTPDVTARVLRTALREAIVFERDLYGENLECGGDVDAVIVDSIGVRDL